MTIGVTYMMLTLPVALYVITISGPDVMLQEPRPLAFTIVKAMYDFNYATDAFLYVFAGSIIRKEIVLMLYEVYSIVFNAIYIILHVLQDTIGFYYRTLLGFITGHYCLSDVRD